METYGIWSLLPPVGALGLALWKKQIYPALLFGVWLGWWVLEGWNPFTGLWSTAESLVSVFSDADNTRIIFYSLLVGATLTLMSATGGVEGFVGWLDRRNWVKSRRQAQLVPFLAGVLITVESSITALVAGTVGRPLTDRHGVSREKLAYICDSTSAPICILVPFNGWGAYIIGLLAVQGVDGPVAVLLRSVVVNFYPMAAILIVLISIVRPWEFGPMREAERRAREEGKPYADGAQPMLADDVIDVKRQPGLTPRARNLIMPVITMVVTIVIGIYLTGRRSAGPGADLWDIVQASSGATAVFWAVIMSLAVLALFNLGRGRMSSGDFLKFIFKGMGGMIPVVSLLILAFALGDTVRQLGMGEYVAGLMEGVVHTKVAVAGLFLIACFVAFATGTSWGTFAVMVPIAVPMATALGGSIPMFLAAVLGGGIFGDHCSPISDTTIISSMASASDHMDHVRTQIPYALIGAGIASFLYLLVS
ncbi:MAG: Na+/H+ antiporter NhaC family protein [Candidatus Neomarinimicrobiota bacterium]